jgi:redox-sensitive bicupin YhaK (pirin superfamily)
MEDQFEKGAFDVHPHRGIETLTYIIDGRLQHYDNATTKRLEHKTEFLLLSAPTYSLPSAKEHFIFFSNRAKIFSRLIFLNQIYKRINE